MHPVRNFRDLEVWKTSMALAIACYQLTESFPPSERWGLTSQIRRAAVAIPANIAEGHGRSGAVFRNHLRIAMGSHAEVDTLLELAARLGYLPPDSQPELLVLLRRTIQMLHGLMRALRSVE